MRSHRWLGVAVAWSLVSATLAAEPSTPAAQKPGSPPSELDAKCASGELACRKDVRIVLQQRSGERFEFARAFFPPALQGDLLTIIPGEELLVEARADGDRLVLERVVKDNQHPERTLQLSFRQAPDDKSMLLVVRNPFDRPVKYDARMMPLEDPEERLHYTSSCPVLPKLQAFESWPFPIFQLALGNFRFVAEKGDCE